NLIDSHSGASGVRLTKMDLDRDGYQELLAETAWMNLYLKPSEGATAIEIDYRPKALCLTHLPMRRPEAYHEKLKTAPVSTAHGSESIASIHERVAVKASAADSKLIYDRHLRWSFRDCVLNGNITLTEFETSQYQEISGFADQPYETKSALSDAEKAILSFHRTDSVDGLPLTVKKIYTLWASRAELAVNYSFQSVERQGQARGQAPAIDARRDYYWGVELNLTLLAGSDPKRYYHFPGRVVENTPLNSKGILEDLTEARLVDEWQGIEIRLEFKPAVRFWRFPIETISQSEEGMESNYQGSCLVALWPLTLPLKEKHESLITMKIVER
ncbi:MAG TPA: alpha-amylase/4-alpha-glucanotransferase domain-containing protein, partial [Nitrospiria bacterium]|nr:alpha-amylase/4-alpha-glucanotransferase domain-containing protein [Nitrospiria bacterium]